MVDRADAVFTMGCSIDEICPAVFVPSEDWGLEDPTGRDIHHVRRIRDQIEAKVQDLNFLRSINPRPCIVHEPHAPPCD